MPLQAVADVAALVDGDVRLVVPAGCEQQRPPAERDDTLDRPIRRLEVHHVVEGPYRVGLHRLCGHRHPVLARHARQAEADHVRGFLHAGALRGLAWPAASAWASDALTVPGSAPRPAATRSRSARMTSWSNPVAAMNWPALKATLLRPRTGSAGLRSRSWRISFRTAATAYRLPFSSGTTAGSGGRFMQRQACHQAMSGPAQPREQPCSRLMP